MAKPSSNYRATYFKAHKPSRSGKYRCKACRKMFKPTDIDIDHVFPKRKGGTDHLWNLQAMCKHCNRSKGTRQTVGETVSTLTKATVHGQLHIALGGMAKRNTLDFFGVKYKR